jgi:hypothetical protein
MKYLLFVIGCQYHLLSNKTMTRLTRILYVEYEKLGNENIIKEAWCVCSNIASTFLIR